MLGPIGLVPEPLFFYRRHPGRTEQDRAARQGGIPDEADVLSARMTHLQEALSAAVRGSALPRSTKLRLQAEIIRAAYLEDTPMRSRTRREVASRAARAWRNATPRRLVKYGVAWSIDRTRAIPETARRWAASAPARGQGAAARREGAPSPR